MTWAGPGLYDRYSSARRAEILDVFLASARRNGHSLDDGDLTTLWDRITDLTSAYLALHQAYLPDAPTRRGDLAELKRFARRFDMAAPAERERFVNALPPLLFMSIMSRYDVPEINKTSQPFRLSDLRPWNELDPRHPRPWYEQGTVAHEVSFDMTAARAFLLAARMTIANRMARLESKQRPGTRRNEPLRWLAVRLAELYKAACGEWPGYSTISPDESTRRQTGGPFARLLKLILPPLHPDDGMPSSAAITTVVRATVRSRQPAQKK